MLKRTPGKGNTHLIGGPKLLRSKKLKRGQAGCCGSTKTWFVCLIDPDGSGGCGNNFDLISEAPGLVTESLQLPSDTPSGLAALLEAATALASGVEQVDNADEELQETDMGQLFPPGTYTYAELLSTLEQEVRRPCEAEFQNKYTRFDLASDEALTKGCFKAIAVSYLRTIADSSKAAIHIKARRMWECVSADGEAVQWATASECVRNILPLSSFEGFRQHTSSKALIGDMGGRCIVTAVPTSRIQMSLRLRLAVARCFCSSREEQVVMLGCDPEPVIEPLGPREGCDAAETREALVGEAGGGSDMELGERSREGSDSHSHSSRSDKPLPAQGDDHGEEGSLGDGGRDDG